MEDGLHPPASVVGAGAGGGAAAGAACGEGADGTPADRKRRGRDRRRGRDGGSRGHGPDRPLDVEEFFGDLAGEHAQLRDDVVFGRRRREERSGAPAGGQVGHRDIDAVPFPELGDRPLEQKGVLRLPGRLFGGFPPGGKAAGRRRRPAPSGGRPAGEAGRKPSPRYPPSSGTRTGRWRCGEDTRPRTPGRGMPERRKREGRRQERREPRVDRE